MCRLFLLLAFALAVAALERSKSRREALDQHLGSARCRRLGSVVAAGRHGDVLHIDDPVNLTDAMEELHHLVKAPPQLELHRDLGVKLFNLAIERRPAGQADPAHGGHRLQGRQERWRLGAVGKNFPLLHRELLATSFLGQIPVVLALGGLRATEFTGLGSDLRTLEFDLVLNLREEDHVVAAEDNRPENHRDEDLATDGQALEASAAPFETETARHQYFTFTWRANFTMSIFVSLVSRCSPGRSSTASK